jgi:hypothetical protein
MAAPRRRSPRRGDQVGQWIAALPQTFIECRDLGHIWTSHRAWWDNAERCYKRVMRCQRCAAERTQSLSSAGLVLSGHYSYVDDYSKPAGTGYFDRNERAALRLESVFRVLDDDEHAENVTPLNRKRA